MCILTGKPVQYECVHVVQCCTERQALHVARLHSYVAALLYSYYECWDFKHTVKELNVPLAQSHHTHRPLCCKRRGRSILSMSSTWEGSHCFNFNALLVNWESRKRTRFDFENFCANDFAEEQPIHPQVWAGINWAADIPEDLHFRMKYPGGTVCSARKIVRVGIVIHQPRDNTSTLVHHLLLEMCDVIN